MPGNYIKRQIVFSRKFTGKLFSKKFISKGQKQNPID
jgi:hypothetical protein